MPSPSAARGVRASAVVKAFEPARRVLDGIDLQLQPGEVVGLIGPNGAGKTTLMSCLLGFLHLDQGHVDFDGFAADDLRIRKRTGFVPERMNLGRRSTGRQFLTYMARLAGLDRRAAPRQSAVMLDRLGLGAAADRPLGTYSRGMLQRIAMCQALIHQPDFLFLDEPASGLDPSGVLLVREVIAEQKRRNATVLLNSHQLSEVEKVCDRVLFLRDGRIAVEETLRNVDRCVRSVRFLPGSYDPAVVRRIAGSDPRDDLVLISAADEAGVAEAVRELVASGAAVVEVRPPAADLERMFRSEP